MKNRGKLGAAQKKRSKWAAASHTFTFSGA